MRQHQEHLEEELACHVLPDLPDMQLGDPTRLRQVLVSLVGGAAPPAWDSPAAKNLTRIVVMFDGRDPAAVETARAAWKDAKAAGHDVTYWKENPTGKWEKQG